MLDAFSSESVLESPRNSIACVHAYSNKLLVVDSQYTLSHYHVEEHRRGGNEGKELLRTLQTIKSFCRSKPTKLHAVKETGMLLVLVDSYLSTYSLTDLTLLQKLNTTKGASSFSVWSGVDHSSGIPVLSTQVAVCVKRQVLLFTWLDSEFEGERHFECPDRGKAVEFLTNEMIVVAMTHEFITIDIKHERIEALQVPIGGSLGTVSTTMGYLGTRAPKPILVRTSNQLLLVKDVQSVFIDSQGEHVKAKSIGWASAPEFVGYTYPYLIVVLKNRVEIRNAKIGTLLQILDIAGVNCLNDGKSLFLATAHKVWRLSNLPYAAQVEQLLEQGHLRECLSLLESLDSVLLEDKAGLMRRTRELIARELFIKEDFDASMDLFGESWTKPSLVVDLLPHLNESRPPTTDIEEENVSESSISQSNDRKSIDESTRQTQKVTEIVSAVGDLQSDTSKAALRSLSTFLARSRRLLSRFLSTPPATNSEEQYFTPWPQCRPLTVDEMEVELGIADTSLLRIYITSSPGLVGSLVRLANRCSPEVVKDYLVKENRWRELVDFYYGKGLHSQALALLQEKNAVDMGIQYLQRLDVTQWDVIKQYAPWVLNSQVVEAISDKEKMNESNVEDGTAAVQSSSAMDIFTDSSRESDSFDRGDVATFLTSVDLRFGIEYLEFIILTCGDTTPHFSEDLIYLYIKASRVTDLTRFMESAENSASAHRIYPHIQQDPKFDEVRALTLAFMGKLDQALRIMVTKVRDAEKTEAFAAKQFKNDPRAFEILLELYLTTPKASDDPAVYVEEALDLLQRHGPRLDADQVLASIPSSTSLSAISDYLRARLRSNQLVNISSLIESKLREAYLLRLQLQVVGQRKRYWEIGVDRVCAVCHKRLGESVLAVFPDGGCVHYGCQKRYHAISP